jgi:hypothetical protein
MSRKRHAANKRGPRTESSGLFSFPNRFNNYRRTRRNSRGVIPTNPAVTGSGTTAT